MDSGGRGLIEEIGAVVSTSTTPVTTTTDRLYVSRSFKWIVFPNPSPPQSQVVVTGVLFVSVIHSLQDRLSLLKEAASSSARVVVPEITTLLIVLVIHPDGSVI
jgi:hypothetical protein